MQNYDEFTNLRDFQSVNVNDSKAVEAFKECHFLTDDEIMKMQEIEVPSERIIQDYKSTYNDIREWVRNNKKGTETEKSDINWDDVTFEIDLLKSQEINLDYILELIFEHNKKTKNKPELIEYIRRVIRASIGNRAKEGLIVDFINETDLDAINDKADIIESFLKYAQGRLKQKQLS